MVKTKLQRHGHHLPTMRIRNIFRLLLLLCWTMPALSSEERAIEIIDEMEQLYRGKSSDATMTMLVKTPNYERTLTMTGQSYGKDYGFFRIQAPKKKSCLK